MEKFKVDFYKKEDGTKPVGQFIRSLDIKMKAKVVESQAQVPIAMGEALRTGKISVMNYYNLKNLLADTQMRESMSGTHSEQLNI